METWGRGKGESQRAEKKGGKRGTGEQQKQEGWKQKKEVINIC